MTKRRKCVKGVQCGNSCCRKGAAKGGQPSPSAPSSKPGKKGKGKGKRAAKPEATPQTGGRTFAEQKGKPIDWKFGGKSFYEAKARTEQLIAFFRG